MKKTAITAALALTAALMTGCTAAAMNADQNNNADGIAPVGAPSSSVSAGIAGTEGSDAYIAQSEAENIALTDAGLTADTVTALHSRLEYDDGRAIYDVEFWTGTDEYDYDIDATSGAILSKDRDAESNISGTSGAASDTTAVSSDPTASGTVITEEAACQAALDHAGVAVGDAQFVHTHLDWEHGRQVYEVEFWSGDTEYDYEIDAATGDVLSFDYDAEYCQPAGSGSGSSALITADEAKTIAFQYAGVSEGDATRVKVDPDEDDDRPVFDIEWRIGHTEYDVTVDALTGSVVSYETDH